MAASAPAGAPCAGAAATTAAAEGGGKENSAAAAQLRKQVVQRILSSGVLNSVKVSYLTFIRIHALRCSCLPSSLAPRLTDQYCLWLLQAHLRAQLHAELKSPGCGSSESSGSMHAWLAAPQRSPSLQQHVLNCLVCEFLLAQRHTYSLSVFLAETGSGALPRLGHPDLLRLLGVLPESKVHSLLTCGSATQLAASPGAAEGASAPAGAGDGQAQAADAGASLAERMVAALGVLGGRVSTQASACQTGEDSPAAAWDAGSGCDHTLAGAGQASSLQLATRLAAIEQEYQRKSGALEAAAAASLEERMGAYQQECDARCAAQLEQRLAALRQGELAAAREEAAAQHAAALAAERAALAEAHQQRLAALNTQVLRPPLWSDCLAGCACDAVFAASMPYVPDRSSY